MVLHRHLIRRNFFHGSTLAKITACNTVVQYLKIYVKWKWQILTGKPVSVAQATYKHFITWTFFAAIWIQDFLVVWWLVVLWVFWECGKHFVDFPFVGTFKHMKSGIFPFNLVDSDLQNLVLFSFPVWCIFTITHFHCKLPPTTCKRDTAERSSPEPESTELQNVIPYWLMMNTTKTSFCISKTNPWEKVQCLFKNTFRKLHLHYIIH